MIKKPVIGISGCLAGSAVRFDGGHKRADFLMDKLVEWVTFRPVSGNGYRAASSASCSTSCVLDARKYTDVFQPRPE